MFKMLVNVCAILVVTLFVILSAWSVTVEGLFEPSSLNVDHFNAGAGNTLFLVRVGLAFLCIVFLSFSIFVAVDNRKRVSCIATAVVVSMILVWSAIGLERTSKGFSEERFKSILLKQQSGVALTKSQVLAELGEPLVKRVNDNGNELWCFTYMPSCGYGWHKRVLVFDRLSILVSGYRMDEP